MSWHEPDVKCGAPFEGAGHIHEYNTAYERQSYEVLCQILTQLEKLNDLLSGLAPLAERASAFANGSTLDKVRAAMGKGKTYG